MRVALAVALLLGSFLLAGCAGGGSVTALEARPTADSAARAWSADAVLVSVSAVEVGNATELEQMRAEGSAELGEADEADLAVAAAAMAALQADDTVGDGRAPAWLFVYMAPEGMRFIVVRGDEVSHEAPMPATGFALPAEAAATLQGSLGQWKVDSDAAAAAARGVPGFAAIADQAGATVGYSFHAGEEGPAWQLVAGNAEEHVAVTVDARDGTVTGSEELAGPPVGAAGPPEPELPPREAGDIEGSTDGVSPKTHAFRVEQAHSGMTIRLETDYLGVGPFPRATVTAPGGKSYEMEPPSTIFVGSGTLVMESKVDAAPAGDWSVQVSTDLPAPTDYTFSWCTDGRGEAKSLAC